MTSGFASLTTQQLIEDLPTEIEKASTRIASHVLQTPLLESPYLGGGTCRVFLKLESEQVTGSFKARGSLNKILSLPSTGTGTTTLVTSSTGNHAQGFARAVGILEQRGSSGTSSMRGIIYMPETAQPAKINAVRQCYPHIKLEFYGQDCSDTEENALKMAQEHNNYIYVPPYNDVHVIAGQGTVGLEILEQSSRQAAMIDVAFVCIGGGGLISGVAAYLKAKRPGVKIVGCQPERSPEMYLSVQKGELVYLDNPQPTLSDGSAGGIESGSVTFPTISRPRR
ncbi:L-threo-3-hydroxyaspartate ammonia-lyase [Seminavis robusta]|uniref:L-threo-3-hydroxyaspartate ammonia-lyase n=1 Tax=Seminavis robusta TaxID=568900 RepID=A0A9N8DWV7_9STRA|nr:L-threo-3-hydroxyaspartate ammonia-lyase [Seminavis robusta]|eukprot:Sro424_g140000.1 L-threo-3-hydroxyaspartate ammonia-lyase (282) ;mRNA; f:52784-53629